MFSCRAFISFVLKCIFWIAVFYKAYNWYKLKREKDVEAQKMKAAGLSHDDDGESESSGGFFSRFAAIFRRQGDDGGPEYKQVALGEPVGFGMDDEADDFL